MQVVNCFLSERAFQSTVSAGMRAPLLTAVRAPGGTTLFMQNLIPLEGFEVLKFNSSVFAFFLLSGCSSDILISPPQKPEYKSMPEITQSVTPSQQRAIMAGERPDWSERTPVPTMKRY